MNSFSMNILTSETLAPKLQRRVYKNLKIQTKKNDSTQALSELTTSDSESALPKRRKTVGAVSKMGRSQDLYETYISASFEDLYEIVEKLGEGAHSVVYSCIQKKNRKLFAVKFLKDCDVQRINDIKQTYFIMKQMNHPFINKAYNLLICQKNSNCYLVSQLCLYKDLRSFIEEHVSEGKKIQESMVADILNNILVALNYLKQKGVCHRDIKPENILYEPQSGEIKLIDFELAKMKKVKEETLELWTPIGSTFYRAPESFVLGYGETVDMWAAGVVAFQLLTNRLPFHSTSMKTVIEQIRNKNIDFDKYMLSSEAKRFLKQVLQKDPKKRWTPQQALRSSFILKNCTNKIKLASELTVNGNCQEGLGKVHKKSCCFQDKEKKLKVSNEKQGQCELKQIDNGIKMILC